MIKSMTGFGRGEYNDGKRSIIVEIKSVNHRYADISVRMPRRYSFAEDRIKNTVKETFKRGKADVSVMVENLTENDVNIRLNTMLARQYMDNLTALQEEFSLKGEVTLQYIAGLPDVMKAIPDVDDEEEIAKCILIPVKEAAENLESMRKIEGEKLADDLIMRGDLIKELAAKIEERADKVPAIYTEKLRERITELIGNSVSIPEERILTEAAIFADKCNITEELTRLNSHMDQMKSIIVNSTQPDGKKLDFLVQEMNREANTILSKANDLETSNLAIDLKTEIEKIREQIQNIE